MEKIDFTNDNYAQKVISAAYDYLAEGSSFRKVAPLYGVSAVTIKYWMDKFLPQISLELYHKVRQSAEDRKEKTIADPEILERVSKAVTYIMEKDMTIKEIAEQLGTTEWTIYGDLVRRLPAIKSLGEQYYIKVRERLTTHSINNSPFLQENNSETPKKSV